MSDTLMTRLADQTAIERVVYDYAAAIDGRDYAGMRAALADNLLFGMRPGSSDVAFVGFGAQPRPLAAAEFIERNRTLFVGFAGTHHQVTNVRIDVDGDVARERAILQATHFLPGDHETEYTFGASYDNRLERTPDGWRFTTIDITVHWERGDASLTERARAIGVARQTDS